MQPTDGVTSPTSARYSSMTQAIKNVAVLRKLEAIERAVGLEKRSHVATARQELALFVNLGADDPLSVSLSRVYHLSGKWTRERSTSNRPKSKKPSRKPSPCCRASEFSRNSANRRPPLFVHMTAINDLN